MQEFNNDNTISINLCFNNFIYLFIYINLVINQSVYLSIYLCIFIYLYHYQYLSIYVTLSSFFSFSLSPIHIHFLLCHIISFLSSLPHHTLSSLLTLTTLPRPPSTLPSPSPSLQNWSIQSQWRCGPPLLTM